MMNNGFKDWYQPAGMLKMPKKLLLVWFSANNAKTTDPCSSIAQKIAAAMNNGMYAITRERSVSDNFLLEMMIMK